MEKDASLNKHILIYIFFSSVIVFSDYVPDILVGIGAFAYVVVSISYFAKRKSLLASLVIVSIEMIPTSFYSILGGGLDDFPVSWFQLMILLAVVYIGFRYGFRRNQFFMLLAFLIFGFVQSFFQASISDALKQVLMISLCLCGFIIAESLGSSRCGFFTVLKIYVAGTIAASLQVLLQHLYFCWTGRIVGWYIPMANRQAFCGAMGDPSFTTLYIATGCVAVMLMLLEYKIMQRWACSICIVIMVSAILRTTSRTGLYALIVTLALYFLPFSRKIETKKAVLFVALIFAIPVIAQIVSNNRIGQALLDGSGRSGTYITGLKAFLQSPFFGIGFGTDNYKLAMGETIPHNFIIQFLAQCGIVGTALVFLPAFDYWQRIIRYADKSRWMLYCILIGAMAIPDIASTRSLYAVVILVGLSVEKQGKIRPTRV